MTKTGFTFVFDRVTGEPVFPIEEAPAPKSEVPGEAAWPTQPRPVKPPPYARQQMSPSELTNVTPESRAYCSKLIEGAVFAPIFTIGLKPGAGTNGGASGAARRSIPPRTHTWQFMDVRFCPQSAPGGSAVPTRRIRPPNSVSGPD